MVAAGEIKPNQRHQVVFIHWKIHDPDKPAPQATLKDDPPPEPRATRSTTMHQPLRWGRTARRLLPHLPFSPEPVDLEAAESRYRAAIEQREREVIQEKLDMAAAKFARSIA